MESLKRTQRCLRLTLILACAAMGSAACSRVDVTPNPIITGTAFVAMTVSEVERSGQLLANGATPIGAEDLVQINPKRPVFYGYVHDPDDLIYEIKHVDVAALDLPTPPVNDYRIRQVAISTPTSMPR